MNNNDGRRLGKGINKYITLIMYIFPPFMMVSRLLVSGAIIRNTNGRESGRGERAKKTFSSAPSRPGVGSTLRRSLPLMRETEINPGNGEYRCRGAESVCFTAGRRCGRGYTRIRRAAVCVNCEHADVTIPTSRDSFARC